MMPRFAPGDCVAVRRAFPPGHIRTPYYVRGAAGVVERICGEFGNPEELAFGREGSPKKTLYRVRFKQTALWPQYDADLMDTIDVEIYEHWLEPFAE